jgi:hypothetical protein
MSSAGAIGRAIGMRRRATAFAFSSPLVCALLALAILIWPVYVFPQGYPQPVTLMLLLSFIGVLIKDPASALGMLRRPEIGLMALFLTYTLVVNLAFALLYQNPEPLRHSAYYLQVLLGCIAFTYALRTEPSAPRLVTLAILGALALQVGTLAVTVPVQGVRATLLFTNPNQLGFFGLLALAFILLLHRYTGYRAWVAGSGAAAALLLVMVSLSKGAVLAALLLLFLYLLLAPFRGPAARRLRPVLLVVFPLALLALAVAFQDQIALLSEVGDRLSQIGESGDDSLAGRGYVRIAMWPQYLLLGAGEGLLGRWEYPREIHSMFGTLLFSYGLPGLAIVGALLAVAFRRNKRDFVTYMGPVLLYSFVHHPMRQVMMWALVISIAHFGPVASARSSRQA